MDEIIKVVMIMLITLVLAVVQELQEVSNANPMSTYEVDSVSFANEKLRQGRFQWLD